MARKPALRRTLGALAVTYLLAGCAGAARNQLEDCRNIGLGLRKENARLQDLVLDLKSRNREMADRAMDDAHRLSQLEDLNARLEKSVAAYQQERDELTTAVNRIEAQVRTAAQPRPNGDERGAADSLPK